MFSTKAVFFICILAYFFTVYDFGIKKKRFGGLKIQTIKKTGAR